MLERVILVGLNTRDGKEYSNDVTMNELSALLQTAGGSDIARVIQNRDTPDAGTFIGAGKAAEIGEFAKNNEASGVIFDNELSPSQTKNLEDTIGLPVIDRNLLIINIFSDRAQTSEGRAQVELARLKYILPRLSGRGTQMSRLGGGGGGGGGARRGAGETKLETDRRHVRERIEKIKKELAAVRHTRSVQRERRIKNEIPVIALIGYTNAGKSTLFNLLCKESISANDRLFDTLDPTTRKLRLQNGQTALLSDTVGFIRKLPHHLIDAFMATLEELKFASVLLHVVDSSHPDMDEQMKIVDELVEQLGAGSIPCLRVYNKCDKMDESDLPPGGGLLISAKNGTGIDKLLLELEQHV